MVHLHGTKTKGEWVFVNSYCKMRKTTSVSHFGLDLVVTRRQLVENFQIKFKLTCARIRWVRECISFRPKSILSIPVPMDCPPGTDSNYLMPKPELTVLYTIGHSTAPYVKAYERSNEGS
jgi:hypothetical protein